jgi:glutathione synthase/RimK-type ligase-like ATP-grasp enzyme
MVICYAGKSAISANAIADEDEEFFTHRGSDGDVNWGRASANTSLNPDIGNSTNKRIMRELFAEHKVPMPQLYSVEDVDNDSFDSYPVVGRPDTHSKGRGFWLCHNRSDVKKALRGTRKKQPATHFMAFVESEHEYRVHIFDGKSLRISEKSFFLDENGHKDYTTIKPTGEVKQIRKAAKRALKATGLDFGAVDILATDNACWVLEVNAAPGLGGTMPSVYATAFRKWFGTE